MDSPALPEQYENDAYTKSFFVHPEPFLVEHLKRDIQPNGSFVPAAQVVVTPALRTSGLLQALPPEELKVLLFLLTFVTPNGNVHPSLYELAEAMAVSTARARARLERLSAFLWRDKALVVALRSESGLEVFTPSPTVLGVLPERPEADSDDTRPAVVTAGREAVIAHSRARYTRPRAEVEREIAELNGWELPESALSEEEREERDLRRKLAAVGLTGEQTALMLSEYGVARVTKQLAWLPYRNARNRAGFLVAAITNDYEAPPAVTTAPTEQPEVLGIESIPPLADTAATGSFVPLTATPPDNMPTAVSTGAEPIVPETDSRGFDSPEPTNLIVESLPLELPDMPEEPEP